MVRPLPLTAGKDSRRGSRELPKQRARSLCNIIARQTPSCGRRTLSCVSRAQGLLTPPHPAILFIATVLLLGYLARKALPARVVVQHLEVLFHAD